MHIIIYGGINMIFNLNNSFEHDRFKEYVNQLYKQKAIVEVKSMNSLIVRYPYFKLFFDYGFGHNHMWVKASGSLERLILVEF